MPTLVVDTDVVSFIFRHDTRAQAYQSHLLGNVLVISFMSVAELDRWALEHHWGQAKIKAMEHHLKGYHMHAFDRNLCLKWAEVTYGGRRKGRPIATGDAWIAATALLHGLPLVTHNRRHFGDVDGLQVISEAPS